MEYWRNVWEDARAEGDEVRFANASVFYCVKLVQYGLGAESRVASVWEAMKTHVDILGLNTLPALWALVRLCSSKGQIYDMMEVYEFIIRVHLRHKQYSRAQDVIARAEKASKLHGVEDTRRFSALYIYKDTGVNLEAELEESPREDFWDDFLETLHI